MTKQITRCRAVQNAVTRTTEKNIAVRDQTMVKLRCSGEYRCRLFRHKNQKELSCDFALSPLTGTISSSGLLPCFPFQAVAPRGPTSPPLLASLLSTSVEWFRSPRWWTICCGSFLPTGWLKFWEAQNLTPCPANVLEPGTGSQGHHLSCAGSAATSSLLPAYWVPSVTPSISSTWLHL